MIQKENIFFRKMFIVAEYAALRPEFFSLVDLREFFFRFRVGGTKKNK